MYIRCVMSYCIDSSSIAPLKRSIDCHEEVTVQCSPGVHGDSCHFHPRTSLVFLPPTSGCTHGHLRELYSGTGTDVIATVNKSNSATLPITLSSRRDETHRREEERAVSIARISECAGHSSELPAIMWQLHLHLLSYFT